AVRFWVAHWVLFLGSFCILGSALLKWIYFAFTRRPLGLQLPFLRNIGVIPHFSVLSYGVVGIAVLTVGLVLFWRSARYPPFAVAILISLWVTLPCQIAFQRPAFLSR